MNVIMSYQSSPLNQNFHNEKREKYVNLHTKLKHQGKLFRKKHETEINLINKEKEANKYCNIFTPGNLKNDTQCMAIWEDIDKLEIKLKDINKQLNCKKYKNKW